MHTQESYKLRWRGRQIGPLTFREIEQQLEDQELGMLHEIFHKNQWKTLDDFYVEICRPEMTDLVEPAGCGSAPHPAADATAAAPNSSSRPKTGARLVPHGVTKTILASGKEAILLDNITFVIEPNEFVALLGPSGSGKSTLMDAMNGRRRATSGSVLVNGDDLYAQFEKMRDSIGYVPQKDIVHLSLTVRQELTFAARLRLPAETPRETIDQIVSDVIAKIGLKERQHTRNSSLSGGQLKRVSVGVELLANPTLLFLDEATSGLDAGTEARMMTLFGKLANEGKTIVCVTHNLESLGLCDLVAILACGKLVYYGPPGELLTYFGVGALEDIFKEALGERHADDEAPRKNLAAQWAERFRSSPYYQRYVVLRVQQKAPPSANPAFGFQRAQGNDLAEVLRQFWILTHRYATVTLQDQKSLFILLAQAPIIAGFIAVLFHNPDLSDLDKAKISFFMAVSAIWFGCNNAAREIVKELPLYGRERSINLRLSSYLGSKMALLSLLCLLQCFILYFLTYSFTSFHPEQPRFVGLLVFTSLCAMMLGLLVSACAKNENIAMAIVPVLLIPQFLFANVFQPIHNSDLSKAIAEYLIVSFWSCDGMFHCFGGDLILVPKISRVPIYSLQEDILSLCLFFAMFTVGALFALKMKDNST